MSDITKGELIVNQDRFTSPLMTRVRMEVRKTVKERSVKLTDFEQEVISRVVPKYPCYKTPEHTTIIKHG